MHKKRKLYNKDEENYILLAAIEKSKTSFASITYICLEKRVMFLNTFLYIYFVLLFVIYSVSGYLLG